MSKNTAQVTDGTATADVRVQHPALWDTAHPNLYTLRTDVLIQGKTVPAAMLDGVTTSGGWSDYYCKSATTLLPAFSLARPRDLVSVSSPDARTIGTVTPYFTVGAGRALPAAIQVSYLRDGHYVPVRHPKITWARRDEPADDHHLRPGPHHEREAGPDEPGVGNARRLPADRRTPDRWRLTDTTDATRPGHR